MTRTGPEQRSGRREFFESTEATTTRSRPSDGSEDSGGHADGRGRAGRELQESRGVCVPCSARVLTNLRSVSRLESSSLFKNEFFELFLGQVIQFHVKLEGCFGDGLIARVVVLL